jgi:NADH dehydrogenase/NADH:ubiquinone oxidoreductase subunit G
VFLGTTNAPTNFKYDTIVPIQSLYEKDGFLFNVEGRLRKYNKAVSASKSRSLESFFVALSILTAGEQTAT